MHDDLYVMYSFLFHFHMVTVVNIWLSQESLYKLNTSKEAVFDKMSEYFCFKVYCYEMKFNILEESTYF